MDLNALYFHYQTAMMNIVPVHAERVDGSHFDLATYYAKRIRAERERLGYCGHSWNEAPRRPHSFPGTTIIRIA